MRKTRRLIRTMLKMQYSTAGKDGKQIFAFIVMGIFLLPLTFIYISVLKGIVFTMYDLLSPTGNANIILGITFLVVSAFLFFISIASILSSFYFSEDVESFIPYPFQPYQLMLAKAASPFINLYLTSSIMFVPTLFVYGIASNAAILYYFYGILLFLMLPIVPFVIAAVILMFFMRFANISKNKDRTKVLAGLLSLVFIIGINVVIRLNQDPENLANSFSEMIQQQNGLLQMVTKFLPTAYFGTMALSSSGSFSGLLFLLAVISISVLGIILFLSLGQKLYFKGVLGLSSGNKSKLKPNKLQKNMKSRPFWLSYMLKELRVLFRTPTFFVQCVAQSLFSPVFLIVIILFESSTSAVGTMLTTFSGKNMILILFIITIFMLGTNPSSISAISKDGSSWFTNLYYPVKLQHIVYSKIGAAWLINLISVVTIFIIGLFFIQLPLIILFLWLFIALESSWFTSLMGTYLDFIKPKLNWTEEQEVFKTRLIGLKALAIEAGTFGLAALILWKLPFISGMWSTATLLVLLLALAIIIVHYLFYRKMASGHSQTM